MTPLFIEEPTHPHDVAAHAAIAQAIAPTPVAVGESIPNRVVFKNFMAAGAVQVCQIDPTRLGGVGEAITCAMMAKKLGLRVIPHVGDMGQLSQHLCLFCAPRLRHPRLTPRPRASLTLAIGPCADHIALGHELEFLEYIPHLREYFVHPAEVEGGAYVLPRHPGASTSIVSEERAQEIVAGGEPTVMHEGASDLGDA